MESDELRFRKPFPHPLSRWQNQLIRKSLFALGFAFLAIFNNPVAYCTESDAASRFAPPRSILSVRFSSNDFLIVGGLDNVSCTVAGAGEVWANDLNTALAGVAALEVPVGFTVFATDVGGGVHAWDKDGKPLVGWPRELKNAVTAAPAWIDWAGGGCSCSNSRWPGSRVESDWRTVARLARRRWHTRAFRGGYCDCWRHVGSTGCHRGWPAVGVAGQRPSTRGFSVRS